MIRFRKDDEFFGAVASPAGWNGDSIFFVNEVTELTGVESLRKGIHARVAG